MESFVANQTNSQSNVNSETNPSIFEVLAQQSLASGLRRAANFICRILYQNNENYVILCNNFDELYLLFDICVQLSHLRAFNASFSEHFYSLKRVSNNLLSNESKLNRKQFFSSLVLLTAFPYIQIKFDSLYRRLKFTPIDSQMNRKSYLRLIFLKFYPIFCSFCQLITLYYQMSYTVGQNSYYSPLLRLSNVRLINMNENDLREKRVNFEALVPNTHWFQYISSLSWLTTKWLAKGFSISLSVSAFFIQFLDFWYTRDNSFTSFASLPIPPPPEKYKIEIPIETCPICLRTRQNDTALMTSGFVFCYSCITNYLIHNNRCPVTGYPSCGEHLIKLYPPDSN